MKKQEAMRVLAAVEEDILFAIQVMRHVAADDLPYEDLSASVSALNAVDRGEDAEGRDPKGPIDPFRTPLSEDYD